MPSILVTGATGTLGKELCKALAENNILFKGTSRNPKGDDQIKVNLDTGDGLDEALKDCNTVIHLASNSSNRNAAPDSVTTNTLIKLCKDVNLKHFIYVSIVGIDKMETPYYKEKLKSEDIVKLSGLPYTILRTTQFHEFTEMLLDRYVKRPIGFLIKSMKFQSIETTAVANKLIGLYRIGPSGSILNQGGPEILTAGKMAKLLFKARGETSFIIPVPVKGSLPLAFKNGYNTCTKCTDSSVTWSEYLERKYKR